MPLNFFTAIEYLRVSILFSWDWSSAQVHRRRRPNSCKHQRRRTLFAAPTRHRESWRSRWRNNRRWGRTYYSFCYLTSEKLPWLICIWLYNYFPPNQAGLDDDKDPIRSLFPMSFGIVEKRKACSFSFASFWMAGIGFCDRNASRKKAQSRRGRAEASDLYQLFSEPSARFS